MNNIKTYDLENENIKVTISNLGAAILNLYVNDKHKQPVDIALGHKTLEHYRINSGNLGVVVGRNANRIKDAKVSIDGVVYDLEKNDGQNNLHTGAHGLQYKLFEVEQNKNSITLKTTLIHLEDGFPGNLDVTVQYILDDHKLEIKYSAVSDKDTIINLTNHSYFNLNGQDASSIYDHELYINSDFYMPNTSESIPTKEIINSLNTGFDFKTPRKLKDSLCSDDAQIKAFNGIDHNFLLDDTDLVASLYSPKTGINMNVYTDLNAMHVYTANHFPDESTIHKHDLKYPLHGGIAFETQFSPNALQTPWLKSSLQKAHETFETYTSFEFTIK